MLSDWYGLAPRKRAAHGDDEIVVPVREERHVGDERRSGQGVFDAEIEAPAPLRLQAGIVGERDLEGASAA